MAHRIHRVGRPAQGRHSQRLDHTIPPPLIPDPNIGNTRGYAIHICSSSAICSVCHLAEPASSSSHHRVRNLRLNMYTPPANAAVTNNRGIPTLAFPALDDVNFTLQRSNNPMDPKRVELFFEDEWIASIGPLGINERGTARVEVLKSTREWCGMTRANIVQDGCVIEWIMRGSPHNRDVGRWGFYRYPDGSVRIWQWLSHQRSEPILCAWTGNDEHWYLNTSFGSIRRNNPAIAALFLVMIGIVVYNENPN
ncbi:hypothetical protein FB45DRAFT_1007758 [Roridomyces roridus]|uniref:Uncharacterized protein n=1 Tax=Roridomyces roridus TaxID=1738132 RepID=A0AAD7BD71_9AGAR|nr:hypothetical protein FB45DRAFT_1007758 [Roridomyces roridus]